MHLVCFAQAPYAHIPLVLLVLNREESKEKTEGYLRNERETRATEPHVLQHFVGFSFFASR